MPQSVGNVCSPRFYLAVKRACGELSLLQNYTGSRPRPQIDEKCIAASLVVGCREAARPDDRLRWQRQRFSEKKPADDASADCQTPATIRRACAHSHSVVHDGGPCSADSRPDHTLTRCISIRLRRFSRCPRASFRAAAHERRNRRLRGISAPAATFNAISAMNCQRR